MSNLQECEICTPKDGCCNDDDDLADNDDQNDSDDNLDNGDHNHHYNHHYNLQECEICPPKGGGCNCRGRAFSNDSGLTWFGEKYLKTNLFNVYFIFIGFFGMFFCLHFTKARYFRSEMELDPQLVDPICEGSIVQVDFDFLVLCKFCFSLYKVNILTTYKFIKKLCF